MEMSKKKKYLKASELVRGEWYVNDYDGGNPDAFIFESVKRKGVFNASCIFINLQGDAPIVRSCNTFFGSDYIRKPTNKELKKLIEMKPDWFEVKVEDCKEGEYYFLIDNDGDEWIIKGDPLDDNCDCYRIGTKKTYPSNKFCYEPHVIKYIRKATPKEIKKFNRAFGNTCGGNCDKCRCEIMDKAKQVSEVMADISKLEFHTHTDEPVKITVNSCEEQQIGKAFINLLSKVWDLSSPNR